MTLFYNSSYTYGDPPLLCCPLQVDVQALDINLECKTSVNETVMAPFPNEAGGFSFTGLVSRTLLLNTAATILAIVTHT